MKRAIAVVDLGFGDGGKGLLTDFLARETAARLVVRFNGGAQAGHNVVAPDGRHHTFAQFGAASFIPGVRTFLSRFVAVHPTALRVEAELLEHKGVARPLERLAVCERALVITPFHQAANRIRELLRGPARHGSCGVGFGEAVGHALEHPNEAIRAADLRNRTTLRSKLLRVRDRLAADLARDAGAFEEWRTFTDRAVIDAWISQAAPLADCVVDAGALRRELDATEVAIFEGAQGVLLDETFGFAPHTSWSRCTAENARALVAEAAADVRLEVWGVLRSHVVRHGAGPLPTECDELRARIREHNAENAWQGRVRYGWFDAVLARYALKCAGALDALAMTHLDLIDARPRWPVCTHYERGEPGPALAKARPALADCESPRFIQTVEQSLERRIDAVSRGPRAADVTRR